MGAERLLHPQKKPGERVEESDDIDMSGVCIYPDTNHINIANHGYELA